jgi:hypothetical protein
MQQWIISLHVSERQKMVVGLSFGSVMGLFLFSWCASTWQAEAEKEERLTGQAKSQLASVNIDISQADVDQYASAPTASMLPRMKRHDDSDSESINDSHSDSSETQQATPLSISRCRSGSSVGAGLAVAPKLTSGDDSADRVPSTILRERRAPHLAEPAVFI